MCYYRELKEEVNTKKNITPILVGDKIFKDMMMTNEIILKHILLGVHKIDADVDDIKLNFITQTLPLLSKYDYSKTVDILVYFEHQNKRYLTNIELNSSHYNTIKLRNLMYLERSTSLVLKKGENIDVLKNAYVSQINLNIRDTYSIDPGMWKFGNDIMTDTRKIYVIPLAKYLKRYYNGDSLKNHELIFAMLMMEKTEDMRELIKKVDDKRLRERLGGMMQFILDNFKLTPEEEAAFEELNRQAYYEELKIEKRKMAKELRKEISAQEMAKGKKENNILTVKNMLKEKLPYDIISRVSGLSVENIQKIQNQEQS